MENLFQELVRSGFNLDSFRFDGEIIYVIGIKAATLDQYLIIQILEDFEIILIDNEEIWIKEKK